MEIEFGTIEPVALRTIWTHEEYDFTPWLCQNINKLSEAIGIDIEFRQREVSAGGYELDILAHDIGRDKVVIIENQLEATDHKHLGQLITYASYFKAGVIIWISSKITEEHRGAIDWLNNNTSEDIEFFAVELGVVRIGDSKPALNLKLKAFPNEWQKSAVKRTIVNSENGESYRMFFQTLIDELREKYKFTNAKKANPTANWFSFSAGVTGVAFSCSFARAGKVRVELYISTGEATLNKAIFKALEQDKEQYQQHFNGELIFDERPDKKTSSIVVFKEGSIDDSTEALEKTKQWMLENLLKFKEIFGPNLPKALNTAITTEQ